MDLSEQFLVGWIVTNLPVIIDTVKILLVEYLAGILKNWFEGTINFFTGFTSNLGDIATRAFSFDFLGQKKQIEEASDKAKSGAQAVTRDFLGFEQALRNFDLFKILGDTAKKILVEVEDPESPSSGQQGQGQGQRGKGSKDQIRFLQVVKQVLNKSQELLKRQVFRKSIFQQWFQLRWQSLVVILAQDIILKEILERILMDCGKSTWI